jgi:hypothetical protein
MPFGSFVMKQVLNSGQVTDTTSEHIYYYSCRPNSQHSAARPAPETPLLLLLQHQHSLGGTKTA